MHWRCCVCNYPMSKESGRTFHKFPLTNLLLLEEWMKQLPLKGWKPNKMSVLCSDHFVDDCFNKTGFRTRLKPNSVPTRFENCQGVCILCKRKRTYQLNCTFFKFPLNNTELLEKWLQNINLPNWIPTEHSLLCSNHFNLSDLKLKGKYLKLKKNSIPILLSTIPNNPHQSNEGVLHAIENISICRRNDIDQHSITSKELSTPQPMTVINNNIGNTTIKNLNHTIASQVSSFETNNERSTVLETDNFDSSSPVRKLRRVEHDHQYEISLSTLHQKLAKCKDIMKKQQKIIQLQKQKINRFQNRLFSFKQIILELRQKHVISDNCLQRLESLNDKGVKEFLECAFENGESTFSQSK